MNRPAEDICCITLSLVSCHPSQWGIKCPQNIKEKKSGKAGGYMSEYFWTAACYCSQQEIVTSAGFDTAGQWGFPLFLASWPFLKNQSISFTKFKSKKHSSIVYSSHGLKRHSLSVIFKTTASERHQRNIRRPCSGSSVLGNKCLPALVAAPQASARVPLPSRVSRMLIRSYGFVGHAGNAGDTGPSMSRVPSWNVFLGVIFSFLPVSLSAGV